LALLSAAGCGGGDRPPAYVSVTGTVTLDGKPMPDGQIMFTTDGRPPTIMDIVDGQYKGQAMVGTNKIQITRMRDSAKVTARLPAEAQTRIRARADSPVAQEETIPATWNSKSNQVREIADGAENKFDFDIRVK
jgi:hypothetical protein